jgi:hypothetical protein
MWGCGKNEHEEKVGAHILWRSIYLADTPDSVYLSIVLV